MKHKACLILRRQPYLRCPDRKNERVSRLIHSRPLGSICSLVQNFKNPSALSDFCGEESAHSLERNYKRREQAILISKGFLTDPSICMFVCSFVMSGQSFHMLRSMSL